MAETEDEKRRAALQRMRDLRGTSEGKPQQILAQPSPPAQGGAGAAQGAKLRELLAKRQGAGAGAAGGAGGAQGAKLRELLAKRQGAGAGAAGGAQGAKLRELLAKRQGAGAGAAGGAADGAQGAKLREFLAKRQGAGAGAAGAGQGAKLRDLLANRAGNGAAAPGGAAQGDAGNRPFLQKLMAQRAAAGKTAETPPRPAPAAAANAGNDPEMVRNRLRERIGKLQARLEEIEKAGVADDGIEDATVTEETPGPGVSGN